MKRFAILLVSLLLSSAATMATPTLDYSKLPAHPRLIVKSGDVEALRQKLATDAPLAAIHEIIEERSDSFMDKEPTKRIMVGKRLLGRCRTVLERVCFCSYMYLMSGDEVYARRAEKEMLAAASFSDWNPKHFLDVGEMTTALAIGYDWLYSWLSPESRKTIEDAIIEKGLRAANHKAWWSRSHNNWNQVCNGGLVMGALAVYERAPELAQTVIREALEGNPAAQACYGPDGVYPEGFGYWEYGTWYEVLLIESMRTALGTSFDLEKAPGFLESAKFMNFMMTPTGRTFNFSDCGNPDNIVSPLFYWFALETNDMSLVWQDRKRMVEEERVRGIGRHTPAAMFFAARCDLTNVKPIKEKCWYGQGEQPLFLYRSGFGSKEDSYLGVKGGTARSSHAHMDSGTFIYEWGGVRWAMDLGNQDYHSLEKRGIKIWSKGQKSQRWGIYRLNNYSHNTLTVNNALHRYDGMAEMVKVYKSGNKNGAKFDMSTIFLDLGEVYRTIYIDKKDKVTCIDEIQPLVNSKIRWNMVTPAKAKIIDDHTISLTRNGKEVILRTSTPQAKAYIMSNNTGTEFDVRNKGSVRVGFNLDLRPNEKCKLKVELVPQK